MNISRNSISAVSNFATLAGVSAVQQTSNDSSSTTAVGAPQGDSFQSDFASLLKAVQAGDIGTAQSALTTLQSDVQGTSAGYSPDSTSSSATSNSAPQTDLDALFQAVKTGDLTSAQTALTQLQTDSQTAVQQSSGSQGGQQAHGHRHHHHGGGGGGGGGLAAAVSQAFDTTQSTTAAADGSVDPTAQSASA